MNPNEALTAALTAAINEALVATLNTALNAVRNADPNAAPNAVLTAALTAALKAIPNAALDAAPNPSLDNIVTRLQAHYQRATYGAVGGVVHRLPLSVMTGRLHNHINSWVVNLKTHLPTDYLLDEQHPQLEVNKHVIETLEELLEWLDAHP